VRQVYGAWILTDAGPYPLLYLLLLLGDVADAPSVLTANERARGRVGIFPLSPSVVRILRPLMRRG
jgi:hypothetical protein